MKPISSKSTFNHGKEGPWGFAVFGSFLVVLGGALWIELSELIWPSIFCPIGLAMLLSFSGVVIDCKKRKYKNFIWVLGLKVGRWNTLESYPDLLLLRKKMSMGYNFYPSDTPIYVASSVRYELLFASPNHLRQVLVCRYDDKTDAYEEIRRIEEQMGCEWVQYNPGMRYPRKKLS